MIQVINIRKAPDGWKDNPDYVYIGRANGRYGVKKSKWGNPYKLPHGSYDTQRQHVMEQYLNWLMSQPDLLAALHELQDKILVCWCHPKSCHGDILAALADERETTS